MAEFRVLGPLEVRVDDRGFAPSGPMVRKILALLLLRRNQLVSFGTFAAELWGDNPRRTEITTIRSHVYHLRKMLGRQAGVPGGQDLIAACPTGYTLKAPEHTVDAELFARHCGTGSELLSQGRAAEAARELRGALALWRGEPLANVVAGRVLVPHQVALLESRLRARELRIEADLRLGRHRELVAELRELVAANPLNEWLRGALIESLRGSGRRDEALAAFHDLRRALDEKLGLQPSAHMWRLQRAILTDGAAECHPWIAELT
jgi:SARP family transcriptional regulator, regulator of embCAB operon